MSILSENMCRHNDYCTYGVTDRDVSLWQAGSVWEGPGRVPGDQEAGLPSVLLCVLGWPPQHPLPRKPTCWGTCSGLMPWHIGSYCCKQLEPLQYCKAYYNIAKHITYCMRYVHDILLHCNTDVVIIKPVIGRASTCSASLKTTRRLIALGSHTEKEHSHSSDPVPIRTVCCNILPYAVITMSKYVSVLNCIALHCIGILLHIVYKQ